MNICAHGVMNGIRKWIMESDRNTFRIHISHTDMDGSACHVMSKYATNIMNPHSKSQMIQWGVSAGMENIERAIKYLITKLETVSNADKKKYIKGKKKLFLLITDLGNFNPGFINSLISEGHLINYVLVDHHCVDCDFNKIELIGNMEEFQKVKNCYYVDTTYSASKSFGNAIISILNNYQSSTILSTQSARKKYQNAIEHIRAYLDKVDIYDRGKWGKWAGLEVWEVDGSIREQLFFNSFKSQYRNKYISTMVNYFQTILLGVDLPRNECPKWFINTSYFVTKYSNIVESQLKILNNDLDFLKNAMHKKTIDFDIPEKLLSMKKLSIQEIILPEDKYIRTFSFCAKEILENDQDIDILILVSMKYKSVELRTAKDEINVAEIALLNGGGGHQKASGFPFNENIYNMLKNDQI